MDDGCPDYIVDNKPTADSDGDNIPDYLDSCPNQPETFNGVFDVDGCPDTTSSSDRDLDGIPDNLDACPLKLTTDTLTLTAVQKC